MRAMGFWVITITLALLGLAAVGPARAEDFTFTVPVNFSSMPATVTEGAVRCLAGTSDLPIATFDGVQGLVGTGTTTFPIDTGTGTFAQNVVVKFNADAGKNAATATRYKCVFLVRQYGNMGMPNIVGVLTKPGSPFVIVVGGNLPQ